MPPGVAALMEATWLDVRPHPVRMPTYLANTLDPGEASVIHLALDENVAKVCIDEVAGRRIARLHGLTLTGSLGILVKAQRQGFPIDIATAIDRMRTHGIWLSETVVRWAISATNLPNDSN